jgi:hypothetical protein
LRGAFFIPKYFNIGIASSSQDNKGYFKQLKPSSIMNVSLELYSFLKLLNAQSCLKLRILSRPGIISRVIATHKRSGFFRQERNVLRRINSSQSQSRLATLIVIVLAQTWHLAFSASKWHFTSMGSLKIFSVSS